MYLEIFIINKYCKFTAERVRERIFKIYQYFSIILPTWPTTTLVGLLFWTIVLNDFRHRWLHFNESLMKIFYSPQVRFPCESHSRA